MKTSRNPKTVHPPLGAYVHQIEVTGNNRWLNLSGQVGMDIDKHIPENVAEQFKLALHNLALNLEAAGMSVKNLTKMVLYFVDPIDLEVRTKILTDFLAGTEVCMTLLYVKALAAPTIKLEIDAWASKEID
ncbi:RidA family protein [Enterococcus sp. LJL99]